VNSLHAEHAPFRSTRPIRWRGDRSRSVPVFDKLRGIPPLRGHLVIFAAALLLAFGTEAPSAAAGRSALAQLTLPAAPSSSASVVQEGIYVSAPISIDGTEVFRIAAPANPPSNGLPIALRATYIQGALDQVLASTGSGKQLSTVYDPKSMRIELKREGDIALLEAVDAKHRTPLPIVTVTSVDARYYEQSVDSLAAQWQVTLQSALVRALEIRQPTVERRTLESVLRIGLALILLSLAAWAAIVVLARRIKALAEEAAKNSNQAASEQAEVSSADDPQRHRRRTLALAIKAERPAQRLALYRALVDSIVWSLLLFWLIGLIWGLSQFPQTASLAAQLRLGAVGVASVVVVTGLLNRLLDVLINRAAGAWRMRAFGPSEDRARQLLRIATVARAVAGFKTSVLLFLAVLAVMSQVGVPIGSVVTIGGLAAIALSFAAQNFVRDFLNGFLVLLEDQYVVGDYVTINNFSGIVENLTLRMVQIRDLAGDLITIAHGSATSVINQSRNWSRVDYRVSVDPAADTETAVRLVREAIEDLAKDEAWHGAFVEPVEWIGIDQLNKDAIVIRASVKTAPLRQFELRRQINARVRTAFAKAGIAFGAPLEAA
jgi:small conductance mechanosensitive channel